MKSTPYLFADFQPAALLGEHTEVYDAQLAQRWQAIFAAGADGDWSAAEAPGIAVALMMRSYLAVVTPRPPGNIHAGQQLQFEALPEPGEPVRTRISCVDKEIRRERRFVELDAVATGRDERPLYRGRLKLVWAA